MKAPVESALLTRNGCIPPSATMYVIKNKYKQDILEIKNILIKISDKLDSKVDKR